MTKILIRILTYLTALSLASIPPLASAHDGGTPDHTHAQVGIDLIKTDNKVGDGPAAIAGKRVTIRYGIWVYDANATDQRGQRVPGAGDYTFILGDRKTIGGIDEGIVGMKVGGRRTLIIPPQMGFGINGAVDYSRDRIIVPPNATLVVVVELQDLK